MTRKTPRVVPLAIYIGKDEVKARRIAHLDYLASILYPGDPGGRSRLIQDLADGRYDYCLLDEWAEGIGGNGSGGLREAE